MARSDHGQRDEPRTRAPELDANGWGSVLQSLDVSPATTDGPVIVETELPVTSMPISASVPLMPAPAPAPRLDNQQPDAEPVDIDLVSGADPAEGAEAETPIPPRRKRPRRRFGFFTLAVVIGLALLGFGLHEHSNATASSHHSATLVRRTQVLDAQIRLKTQQLAASQARVAQLDSRISALIAGTTPTATSPAQLRQIADAVPPVTDGLRQCVDTSLATASNALDFAAGYPDSPSRVTASATSVAKDCGKVGEAANTLDALADRMTR